MSTRAVFSNDFYTSRHALWKSDTTTEKLPDGGTRYTMGGGPQSLWSYQNRHASLDSQGAISITPSSRFDHLKRYFHFSQNQDLIAVHKKLKNLQNQDRTSPELQDLKNEIHSHKTYGARIFSTNLQDLNSLFERGNKAAEKCSTVLKVVNFIRKLFGMQAIQHYHYDPIDFRVFEEKAILPALELTPQEIQATHYYPVVEFHSNLPYPSDLTHENMQKVEAGFIDNIQFCLEGNSFSVTYDKTLKQFIFSYTNSDKMPSCTDSYERGEDFSYVSDPVDVVEKQLTGPMQSYTHPLRFKSEMKITQNNWFSKECKISGENGTLALNANSEYIIPLSQGTLNIKMWPRI